MADISYTPTTWADGSEGGTPIDAAKLNNIESGIVDAVAAIGPNDTTADGTLKAQIDALGESVSFYKVYSNGTGDYTTFASMVSHIRTNVNSITVVNFSSPSDCPFTSFSSGFCIIPYIYGASGSTYLIGWDGYGHQEFIRTTF